MTVLLSDSDVADLVWVTPFPKYRYLLTVKGIHNKLAISQRQVKFI